MIVKQSVYSIVPLYSKNVKYWFWNFVLYLSDIENPIIDNCPSDQTGDTDDGSATGTVTWTPPTTTDNSDIWNLTSNHLPGDSFDIGSTTVIYTSTDSSFNTVNCTFNVYITGNPYKKLVW